MINDVFAVMRCLGHERFLIGANDLGARVAHRMGLDHPDQVAAMTLHDIAHIREIYAIISVEFARAFGTGFFDKARPAAQKIIGADPETGNALNRR